MPEIGTSGLMSGDGKRGVGIGPNLPRPSSTLPEPTNFGTAVRLSVVGVMQTLSRIASPLTLIIKTGFAAIRVKLRK
jgi:hypothetical protein